MSAFIDSHAHLDGPDFDADRDDVLARAKEAGLTHIVCIGASHGFESNTRTLDFVRGRSGFYASVGIHPHDADIVTEAMMGDLSTMADEAQVVAIGETGLDYFYDQSPRDKQQACFRDFIAMGREKKKPVIIHTRDADDDTIAILREEHAEDVGGVIHCFTGTQRLADAALELGFYISFSGILTFKSAEAIREVARTVPKDRVLVETDCPYLAPVPKRGKRNEPSYVVHTAACLAELWGGDVEEVKEVTGANALRFFGIDA